MKDDSVRQKILMKREYLKVDPDKVTLSLSDSLLEKAADIYGTEIVRYC